VSDRFTSLASGSLRASPRARSRTRLLPLALVPGCYLVDYETIDDACPDHVKGQRFLKPGIQDMLPRINCHRRYVGLAPVQVTRGIQDAIDAHATYLDQNQVLEPASPHYAQTAADLFDERPEWSFFTGTDSYARLYNAHAIDETAPYTVWQVFVGDVSTLNTDRQFDFWGFRDVAFQPLIIGGGYAEITPTTGVTSAYMNLIFALPANRRIDVPVVYPKDGQTDVPISFASPYAAAGVAGDPLAVRSVTGYPITVTVGSYETQGDANPYDLRVYTATLTGPEGELELVNALPGNYPWGSNLSTAAFASVYPLQPGATYTFEADLSWNAKPHKHVVTTFTTADTSGGGAPADTDL
jgi:hypothetical protein